ncbi:UNVERIFIED_CONTAM: hypothetical protein Sindi_0092400 [Sesamum indicum]
MKKSHKPTKPPVNVYVPKVSIPPPQPPPKEQKTMKPVVVEKPKTDGGDMHVDRNNSKQEERGKALVLYNTFDALHLIDDADEHSGVLTQATPYAMIHVEHRFVECAWAEQTRPSARFKGPCL